jgi:hypothetical protein
MLLIGVFVLFMIIIISYLKNENKQIINSEIPNSSPIINSEIPKPSPIIKFIKGDNQATEYNSLVDTYSLDKHNINCESDAINNFKIELSDNKNELRYNYNCSSGGDFGEIVQKNTGFNDGGQGTVIYLDRHNVDCGSNSLLNNFYLTKNPDNLNDYRYNYNCINSNKPLTCRTVQSEKISDISDGNKNIFKLSSANLLCNEDEALNKFKLFRPDGNSVQYDYTCCKY